MRMMSTWKGRLTPISCDRRMHMLSSRASIPRPRDARPAFLAVYTIDDVDADGLDQIRTLVPVPNRDGSDMVEPDYPLLARGRVKHVGNMVAMVIAETEAAARDACR